MKYSIFCSQSKKYLKEQNNSKKLSVLGTPLLANKFVCIGEIEKEFELSDNSLASFIKVIKNLNGFWACIWEDDDILVAAVDHVRTIPLFYGKSEENFYVSDSAEWIRQHIGDNEMDPCSESEFQLTGYVTGSDTLFPNVKQLQAGEIIFVKKGNEKFNIQQDRHYRFLHDDVEISDEFELKMKLDRVAIESMKRLIEYANGRQIVVPLSGGHDSRLIVTLLKRLNYKNILTFTYGVPNNQESITSEKVARELGLTWHFVEYTSEMWKKAWEDSEIWEYQEWSSGWSSLPFLFQDWLAIRELKHRQVIEIDCVFVPGHSGDFVAGSHIPKAIKNKSDSPKKLSKEIFKRNYILAPLFEVKNSSKNVFLKKILEVSGGLLVRTRQELISFYENWDWQERQAKYICNSARAYEFFSYDWWFPQWDKDFIAFWQKVPQLFRKNQLLYIEYVNKQYELVAKVSEINQSKKKFSMIKFIRFFFYRLFDNSIFIPFFAWRRLSMLKDHPFSLFGSFDEKIWEEYILKGYVQLGVQAKIFLNEALKKEVFIRKIIFLNKQSEDA